MQVAFICDFSFLEFPTHFIKFCKCECSFSLYVIVLFAMKILCFYPGEMYTTKERCPADFNEYVDVRPDYFPH